MALDYTGYTHLTAHANRTIDRFREELREKVTMHPDQVEIWRGLYHAYASGALDVWMSATSGLAHAQDAATLAAKVRMIADGE